MLFVIKVALLVVVAVVEAHPLGAHGHNQDGRSGPSFVLPKPFEGLWSGVPDGSMFGAWVNNFTFNIARAPNGDYFMSDDLDWTVPGGDGGWQRFYIEGSGPSAGRLWYCGWLNHQMDQPMLAGSPYLDRFDPVASGSGSAVSFCVNASAPGTFGDNPSIAPWPLNVDAGNRCTGCDCGQWTLELVDDNTLRSHLVMASSMHFDVTLYRQGKPHPVNISMPGHGNNFSCSFAPGGRDSRPVPWSHPAAAKGHQGASSLERMARTDGTGSASLQASVDLAEREAAAFAAAVRAQYGSATDAAAAMRCPFLRGWYGRQKRAGSQVRRSRPRTVRPNGEQYDHCYVLNNKADFRLEWTLDAADKMAHLAISANLDGDDNGYVAIGFRPLARMPTGTGKGELPPDVGSGRNRNFGMMGADIVFGAAPAAGGVQTMYASQFVGQPDEDKTSLKVANATVSTDAKGIVTLAFSRPYVSGRLLAQHNVSAPFIGALADFLWATGTMQDSIPGYHGYNRGVRMINWTHPEMTENPAFKC